MGVEVVELGVCSVAVRQQGKGPTIFLVHGNSCSSRSFEKQLASSLGGRFRLIAMDLPGHGDSPPAPKPDELNTLPGYATAIALAAAKLDASDAVFVGWSLGGHVLLEASSQLPQAKGILLFGAPPISSLADFAKALTSNPTLGVAFRADSTDSEVRALIALFVSKNAEAPDLFFDDVRRTHPAARAALAASLGRGEISDEIRAVGQITCPLAILHGENDQIANNRQWFDSISMPTLWRGTVHDIPGAGHAPHWEASEVFNRLLEEFVSDCGSRA